MIIGYDAKRLFHNATGLGVYSRLLVQGLKDLYPDDEFLLFAKNSLRSQYLTEFRHFKRIESSKIFWRSWTMSRDIIQNGCEIYHGLSHELPMGLDRKRIKTVVTMHDVIFRVDPGLYPWLDRQVYDLKWRYSCGRADVIVAVSEHTKKDLCTYYGVKEDKIQVIPPPIQTQKQRISPEDIRRRFNLPEVFFLYVGALTQRKNVLLILKAMSLITPAKRLPLLVVGSGQEKKTLETFIAKHQLTHLVQLVGHVSSIELPTIYQLAYALIYPSFYEGFGIPIVESLSYKTPVITSKTSAMPEAAGPGGLLIDPNDPEDLAQCMQQLVDNALLYRQLQDEGYLHAQQFNPEVICKAQMQLYQTLIS